MDVRYLLLLILLISCLPESKVGTGNLSGEGTSQTTSGSGSGTSSQTNVATQWNYLGTLSNSITINVSNLNNSYIIGKDIESFLTASGNFSQEYCLVSRYPKDGLTFELRTRAVPVSYYDFTAKKIVKLFRIDFNDLGNSQSVCGTATLQVLDANGNYIPNPISISSSTHNPGLICTNCTSILTSSKLFFFKKDGTSLKELPKSQVDLNSLTLLVDPNNIASTNTGICSQSDCVSRGFDCCLDNQCITNGATRPAASTLYSSQLLSAEQEKLNNPMAYLNYPHLYYICGTSVVTNGNDSTPTSYDQGLTQLKKDYFCVEHMKKYKTGTTFHLDILSGLNFFPDEVDIPDVASNASTLYPTDIECRNNVDPNSTMHYQKVVERLYQNCGCSKSNLNDMITSCPNYEYSVNYVENTGLPNRIDCYTPATQSGAIPSQRTISVNSKSAPHRYFRSCGDEFGSTTPCATGDQQEGDVFEYQDEGKVLPSQENFGMNSILGQMNVSLDKALPAKMVEVEIDHVYQISTTSGVYNPCPSCGKDSWFSTFSPYPTTSYGTGLQAVGHSTMRDSYDYNSTAGNYEDTIFGRACWIPPTMLPYSHNPAASTQTQRLTRLKTQAALYANGYQRDWFGFNKGALIGSFDGVSWFAIGKGRIVRAKTKKLFLAINAPFADLASPTLHVVNIQDYDGVTVAAEVDYDPQYHLSHPYQNEAGNCQANHMCSTDTDCVTRLGWEYMCANVQDIKTKWPSFDVNGKEVANDSRLLTLDQILHQERFPSSSTKRCVYRGAGAVCSQSSGTITDANKRKTLTCAPNFYCANVSSSSPVFNSKVARFGSTLEEIPVSRNHYFGKDANVLGRPLSYTASSLTTTLPGDVRTNLIQNMIQYETSATTVTGLCRPGKAVPTISNQATMSNPFEQHKNADSSGRTDYINQIGGCNSSLFTSNRYSSCPVMNSTGDYEFVTAFNPTGYSARARNQNSCGLDSLLTTANVTSNTEGNPDTLLPYSPFRAILGKTLANQTVFEPTLARDACLRRAGQVCHTDLDCSPNKMHADQTDNFSLAYFGNEAEKKFHSEYLVCGQGNAKPSPFDTTNYKNYNMNKNVCCREVGSDLTTYTANIPLKIKALRTENEDTNLLNDSYNKVSFNLNMTLAPGMKPNDPNRYSRVATVENLGTSTDRPPLSAYQDRLGTGLALDPKDNANVMTPNQWKTLNEANSESCCGGGWIRKFSDGSNDWTKRDRLFMDVRNFACINSRSVMITTPSDVEGEYDSAGDAQTLANQDYGDYCKDSTGTKGSCAQYTISDSLTDPNRTIDTIKSWTAVVSTHFRSKGNPFTTMLDYYFDPKSADGDPDTYVDYAKTSGRRNITIKIPSFITRKSWDDPESLMTLGVGASAGSTYGSGATWVRMYDMATPDSGGTVCEKRDETKDISSPTQDGAGSTYCNPAGADCCFYYKRETRILKVVPKYSGSFGPASFAGKKFAIQLINALPAGAASYPTLTRKQPGTAYHYLRRLGKFELTGIPQITYQPLTCSDNAKRIVPGLFKKIGFPDLKENDFTGDTDYSFSYTDPATSTTDYYTNLHAVDHEPVFSENDFKCCTPLGKSTTTQAKCCSGYGIASAAGTSYTCTLPSGTDLMVYFNRLVSNEGVGSDKPGGGLVSSDFNSQTGEPLTATSVNQKISALGVAYCENGKVRRGGAFGSFGLEPQGNNTNQNEKIYGIVDSPQDNGQLSVAGGTIAVGYNAFMNGYRWNHHLYCDD
jgi:hypothetical protein